MDGLRTWHRCHLRGAGVAARSHSRFRGNDSRFDKDLIPNDTNLPSVLFFAPSLHLWTRQAVGL